MYTNMIFKERNDIDFVKKIERFK